MSVDQQPINRNPSQLLRMLGFSGPDSPDRLGSQVAATVDLLPWWVYAQEQFQRLSTAPGIAFVGFFPAVIVPAGVRWLVTRYSLRYVPAAGGAVSVIGAYDNQATVYEFGFGPQGDLMTNPQLGRLGCLEFPSSYLILAPGDRLGYLVQSNTGAVGPSILVDIGFTQFPS